MKRESWAHATYMCICMVLVKNANFYNRKSCPTKLCEQDTNSKKETFALSEANETGKRVLSLLKVDGGPS